MQAEMGRVANLIAEKQKEAEQLSLYRAELNGQLMFAQRMIQKANAAASQAQPKPPAAT